MNKKEKNEKIYELRKKNKTVAVVLSLFIVGAGSMYAGRTGWGFVQMFISLFTWLFLLGWVMWIISPFLACKDVDEYNARLKLELDLE